MHLDQKCLEMMTIADEVQEVHVTRSGAHERDGKSDSRTLWRYAAAVGACAATTLAATPLIGHVDLANILMLFLLTVVGAGVWLGRGASVVASFTSVAMFDFFFVPPRFSFTVEDSQYLMTFAVMLIVALIIGRLTAHLKRQADRALANERRAHSLHVIARNLAGADAMRKIMEISEGSIQTAIGAQAAFLLPDESGKLAPVVPLAAGRPPVIAPLLARLAYEKDPCTDLDAQYPVAYFPLKAAACVHGVMAIASPTTSAYPLYENQKYLETVASLVTLALDRIEFPKGAR